VSGGDAPGGQGPRRDVLDPAALFQALAAGGVDYVLIGGLAVAAHGAVRATAGLDICPDPSAENLRRLSALLESIDARNLDVMQYVNPFGDRTWEVLSRHAEERQVFGDTIRVCSYEDLVEMKRAAGRDQDRIDIQNMKAARREL
jgi:hypothetical protein